jgi:hypothetical protein
MLFSVYNERNILGYSRRDEINNETITLKAPG